MEASWGRHGGVLGCLGASWWCLGGVLGLPVGVLRGALGSSVGVLGAFSWDLGRSVFVFVVVFFHDFSFCCPPPARRCIEMCVVLPPAARPQMHRDVCRVAARRPPADFRIDAPRRTPDAPKMAPEAHKTLPKRTQRRPKYASKTAQDRSDLLQQGFFKSELLKRTALPVPCRVRFMLGSFF